MPYLMFGWSIILSWSLKILWSSRWRQYFPDNLSQLTNVIIYHFCTTQLANMHSYNITPLNKVDEDTIFFINFFSQIMAVGENEQITEIFKIMVFLWLTEICETVSIEFREEWGVKYERGYWRIRLKKF